MAGVLALIPLAILVLGVVVLIARALTSKTDRAEDGNDLVSYLILAISMIVAGFALANLASTAFPGDRFVFDPADELATSLSALVVSVPFLGYFWLRQQRRRIEYPRSAGWVVYLTIIEAVFLIAFVVAAVDFLDGLFDSRASLNWTGTVVFGGILVFHELAVRRTPPATQTGELRRVIGSAIGLITAVIGTVGFLGGGALDALYESLREPPGGSSFSPWLAILLVGWPIWAYRWLPEWEDPDGVPRQVWLAITSVGSLLVTIGTLTSMSVLAIQFWFSNTAPAGAHFEPVPILAALAIVGVVVWGIHRRELKGERRDPLRAYEYIASGAGLATMSASAIALTLVAFSGEVIVGNESGDVLAIATVLLVAVGVWWWFANRHLTGPPDVEMAAWPRRVYHLGAGVIFGLVAAGSLIAVLFNLLQRALGDGQGSILEPSAALVFTGLPTWYLLWSYGRDRDLRPAPAVAPPFNVTVICSHPGLLAARFPDNANMKVVYRGDQEGLIDDDMADEIVEAVAGVSSIVWVDGDGFRLTRVPT